MPNFPARRAAFRKLHKSGCFVIPNPWDAGSAKYLQSLGFKALATTSGGLAFSLGMRDESLRLDQVLRNVEDIVNATDLPVNADFQAGYADTPEGVGVSVGLCVRTGVAGISIEDATGDPAKPLYELPEALDRLRAAREAIRSSGEDVLLVARTECFLVGHADPLRESVRRIAAYREAGADVLYAPGPATRENIGAILEAATPKPVNVLVSANPNLTVGQIAELGVRRISVGSAFARAAWGGFMQAAKRLAEDGSFGGFENLASFEGLNRLFR